MILKIKKTAEFENGLNDLQSVLEEIIGFAQSATELTKKAKEEKELTGSEYERLLKLVDANETKRFVNHGLVTELFQLVQLPKR